MQPQALMPAHRPQHLPNSPLRNNASGFTLIEVLIVTVLLVFIAFTTFESVRKTVEAKEDIDFKAEILQEGRAVLAIMTHDISLAYFFVAEDFIWEQPPLDPVTQQPPAPTGQKPKPVTYFQGKENELIFSTKSHQRTLSESPEDEMHFVIYQLDGKTLVRGESYRAVNARDREEPSKFRQFTLLEDVHNLKFQYYDTKADKWVDSWDTEKAETLDRLPAAVKVDIEYMPDYDQNRTRRKIEVEKISSAIRITESALKGSSQRAGTSSGQNSFRTGGTGFGNGGANNSGGASSQSGSSTNNGNGGAAGP